MDAQPHTHDVRHAWAARTSKAVPHGSRRSSSGVSPPWKSEYLRTSRALEPASIW